MPAIDTASITGSIGIASLSGTIGLASMSGQVSIESGLPPVYPGPYEVTPTASEQSLGTLGKRMGSDVTVHQVPYYETSNESGGVTVSILS